MDQMIRRYRPATFIIPHPSLFSLRDARLKRLQFVRRNAEFLLLCDTLRYRLIFLKRLSTMTVQFLVALLFKRLLIKYLLKISITIRIAVCKFTYCHQLLLYNSRLPNLNVILINPKNIFKSQNKIFLYLIIFYLLFY